MLKCATDLIATIVVLPDCIDRLNLVIASRAKQSHAAGQRRRWATTPLGNHAAGQRRRWATTPLGNDAAGHEIASSLRPLQSALPGGRRVGLQNDRDRRGRDSVPTLKARS